MDELITLVKIGNYDVKQRQRDGYYNATSLLDEWNVNNKGRKRMDEFFRSNNTKKFVESLCKAFNKNSVNDFMDEIGWWNSGVAGRPKKEVYMHSYLFVEFMAWLEPRLRVQTTNVVYERLRLRHDISNKWMYITKLVGGFERSHDIESAVCRRVELEGGMNNATNAQLKTISEVYDFIIMAFDTGVVNSDTLDDVLNKL